jgi:hypothetical protein
MAEQFVNFLAQTTLSGGIDSSVTALTIVGVTASPATPQFRIRLDSELMLVTSVAGSNYTVTRGIEGTTAAAHSAGATVHYVLTSGALTTALSTKAETIHAASHHSGGSDPLAGQSIAGLLTTSTPTFNGIRSADGSVSAPAYSFTNNTTLGFYHSGGGGMTYCFSGEPRYQFTANLTMRLDGNLMWTATYNPGDAFNVALGRAAANTLGIYHSASWRITLGSDILFRNDGRLGWSSGTDPASTAGDVFLLRDGAAGILAQRNGANTQIFHVYHYYTDATHNRAIGLYGNWEGYPTIWAFDIAGPPVDLQLESDSGYIRTRALIPIANVTHDLGKATNIWREAFIQTVRFCNTLITVGGGASATLGTIGGSGPGTAAQYRWLQVNDGAGAPMWIPVWK